MRHTWYRGDTQTWYSKFKTHEVLLIILGSVCFNLQYHVWCINTDTANSNTLACAKCDNTVVLVLFLFNGSYTSIAALNTHTHTHVNMTLNYVIVGECMYHTMLYQTTCELQIHEHMVTLYVNTYLL
jgi:hypothetical protein